MHIGETVFKKIRLIIKETAHLFDDILFPVYCVRCQTEGFWLCAKCQQSVVLQKIQTCPFCGVPTAYGITCLTDRKKTYLDGLTNTGDYKSWVWRNVVRPWKFGGAVELGDFCSEQIQKILPELPYGLYDPIIIPVPLTKRRFRSRGFNQAQILAKAVAEVIEGEVYEIHRIRETKPQPGLTRNERFKNISGAFAIPDKGKILHRDCIVVDDLLTTGATVNEIAKVLKKSGAKKVWAVTLLRANLN